MSDKELTEYERYIRTEPLLGLQKAPEELSCHDEMAFQMVHQVEELWMKLTLHEIDRVVDLMEGRLEAGGAAEGESPTSALDQRIIAATQTLRRIYIITCLMGDQMRILETLSPRAYFTIRAVLGRGSGQESPGFNAILAAAPRIRAALKEVLRVKGADLLTLQRKPDRDPLLFGLTEALIDFDDAFQHFRWRHLALVRRIIGGRTPSLKGAPAALLEQGVREAFFPELWLVREALFKDFVPGPSLDDDQGEFAGH